MERDDFPAPPWKDPEEWAQELAAARERGRQFGTVLASLVLGIDAVSLERIRREWQDRPADEH